MGAGNVSERFWRTVMQIDVEQLHKVLQLMEEHGVTEIEVQEGEASLHLRRREPGAELSQAVAGASLADLIAKAGLAAPPPAPTAASVAASLPVEMSKKHHEIKSPMVGTFYASSAPDAAAYVQVGDHVDPQTTVCIVEAMKVMNEIKADCTGRIVKVLGVNGKPVEFGQPLFLVEPE